VGNATVVTADMSTCNLTPQKDHEQQQLQQRLRRPSALNTHWCWVAIWVPLQSQLVVRLLDLSLDSMHMFRNSQHAVERSADPTADLEHQSWCWQGQGLACTQNQLPLSAAVLHSETAGKDNWISVVSSVSVVRASC
jgi:hypothetical protein